jgi:ABC-type transporter MlaC component
LHLVAEDWKVYDVVIDNVSLVNNYRSQFDRVIAQSSFEELIRMMKEKQPSVLKKKMNNLPAVSVTAKVRRQRPA